MLSKKARELDQVAHETSPESERGTLLHKAYELQSSDGLSDIEAADYEAIMAQREEITAQWLPNGKQLKRIAEERLWLHRGLRPVLSGQIDELLIQGNRALLFDVKTGRGEVDPPAATCSFESTRCWLESVGQSLRASPSRSYSLTFPFLTHVRCHGA